MKIKLLPLTVLFLPGIIHAQSNNSLSLSQCYELAEKNYPLLQQTPLLRQKLGLAVQNLNSLYLPQLSLQGTATYQSEVTTIPIKIPSLHIPEVPKDQYRATLNLEQLVYDGGAIKKQKIIQQTTNSLSFVQQDITFHQLRKQLNGWYSSALLLQADIQILNLKQKTLQQQISQMESSVKNGAALPSNTDELKASLLQLQQQIKDIHSNRYSTLQAISLITGKPIGDSVLMLLPNAVEPDQNSTIERPELKQFAIQNQLFQEQSGLLHTENIPKLNAFVQGGYGRPGLNMLSDQFNWFYIAGLQLNWNLWDWHYNRRQQQSLQLDAQQLNLQKDNFLLQTNVDLAQEWSEIGSLEEDIKKDEQIVSLREKIRKTASSQLAHGVITPTEYLIQLDDETTARIQQQAHIIQLRFAQLNYQLLKSK